MKKSTVIAILLLALIISACRGDATPEKVPPSGDPAVFLGEPDGQDDFKNDNNWTLFDAECFKSEIDGGQFNMTAKGMQGFYCWEVTWPLLHNYYLESEVKMPDTCDQQDRFGLLLRAPDSNHGYLYGLNCAGQYSLIKWDGQQSTLLAGPTNHQAILSESNQTNRIGIAVSGPDYYLYANGEYLTHVQDSTYLEPGKIGYFINAATTDSFTAKFDNLKVWILEDEFYPNDESLPGFPSLPLQRPESNEPSVTSTVNLNVRSGPGMQFTILGVAPKDTTGEVLGLSPDHQWYAVKVPVEKSGNQTGWVSASYVVLNNPDGAAIPTIQPPLLPPDVNAPPPPAGAPAAKMLETTTVRSGPGLEYPVYGISPTGATAEIAGVSEDGEWWVIKLPSTTSPDGQGWVYSAYVSTTNAENVPVVNTPPPPNQITPAVPGTGAPAVITIEPINVRSGPGNTFPSYGTVPIGSIMAVVGVSPDGEHWVVNLPSEIASDNRGWVPARYTDAQNTGNVPVVQPPAAP